VGKLQNEGLKVKEEGGQLMDWSKEKENGSNTWCGELVRMNITTGDNNGER
jgi:hypothetical protein